MLSDLSKKVVSLVTDNASAILTAGGVIGTVATGVLAARAGTKAQRVIQEFEARAIANPDTKPLETVDKVKATAVFFLPPVLTGTATVAAIIFANRISAQRAAALAAAYGISSKQLEEYRGKLEEKLTPKKYEEARAEIQQDRANKNPIAARDNIVVIGSGEVLCYDAYSDRYFKSSVEYIRKAENVVHREIMMRNECSLQVFYDELDIPQTQISKEVGWTLNHPCNVVIDAILSDDKEPVIAIEFIEPPLYGFDQDVRPRNGY